MDHEQEFEPASANWLVRAYYTPASDALRGRLSGRLDVRCQIASAGLPAPIASLIYTVVRRTRLWRREKLDVARELIAHFADGLAAGRSPELLVQNFGSPQQAARLIRQAKRRNRPLYWQAWWYLSRGLVALLGLSIIGYAVLAARLYVAHPTIAHNYWNDINAARGVPEDERAWPLYRAALIKLGKKDSQFLNEHWSAQPDDKAWPQLKALLDRHRESIDLVREAAAKPHLGYLLGDSADQVESADWILSATAPLAEDNPHLFSMRLDGVQGMRQLARLLIADALRAAADGDGATTLADLSSLLSLSEHTFQPHATLVGQLIGYAIFTLAVENTGTILSRYPDALSNTEWRDLAHRFAAFRDGSFTVDWEVERLSFDDLLQRVYTDDGTGDGRITGQGLAALGDVLKVPLHSRNASPWEELMDPGLAALVGSRRENRDFYNAFLDEMIATHQGPPWQWDHDAIQSAEESLQKTLRSTTGKMHYLFAGLVLPAVQLFFSVPESATQQRDATEVAIALVLWHRQHGDWPQRLDVLVPDLLPAVGPDRYDGRPLRYVVRDGQPIVYSIGPDLEDDHGNSTDSLDFGRYDGRTAAQLSSKQGGAAAVDDDWILWPPPADTEAESSSE